MVLNAFLPSQEIDDPARFAGRASEVREVADALRIEGSVPLIFGHRGLGKSSLARQVRRIAMGDTALLDHLGFGEIAFAPEEVFLVAWVSCTRTTADLHGLLQLMINAIEAHPDARQCLEATVQEVTERTSRTEFSASFVKREWGSKSQRTRRPASADPTLDERLVSTCDVVASCLDQRVLIVVDEVDLLTDTRGLASFLKANSSDWLKFMLVGIADSHMELIADHESVLRSLLPVHVPPMGAEDLDTIIARAEATLAEGNVPVLFRPRSRDRIIKAAAGFPWFVHLLGQSSLIRAYDAGRNEVTSTDVAEAVGHLLQSRLAQSYSMQYRDAVGDSPDRELVLRVAAEERGLDLALPLIEQRAKDLGAAEPRRHLNQLHAPGYGTILRQVREGAFSRFADEMFRTYVHLCPSIYPNIDVRVSQSFEGIDAGVPSKRGRHAR